MRVRHKRMVKQFVLLAGLCIVMGFVLHQMMAPAPVSVTRPFDLERELQALPEDQREAAREEWESLSEAEQDRAKRAVQSLSEEEKQKLIEELKSQSKTP